MNKYFEAEKRLAELLDWRFHGEPDRDGPRWRHATGEWAIRLPRWTRDWKICGPLMVEHEIRVRPNNNSAGYAIAERKENPVDFIVGEYGEHPDKDTAVRYAIVMAVIAKKESEL